MKALLVGIILSAFAVFAALPSPGLSWWDEILFVLKGILPLLALFIGIVAILVGLADLKDARQARKEAADEEQSK